MLKKPSLLTNIILPVILGIVMLGYYKSHIRNASDIGLGNGTSSYFASVNKFPIHISNPAFVDSMIRGWKQRGEKPSYLWQGNSQLHGINQHKEGQVNCIQFLFDSLQQRNEEVLATSYPNGNLQEFLTSVIFLSHKLPLKAVILPVFYDDMREDGIRNEINIPEVVSTIKGDSLYFKNIPNIVALQSVDTSAAANNKGDDFSGIHETAQEKSERFLDKQLENNWKLWKARPDIRGNLFNDIYGFRNFVLAIKSNTVRKMIPGRFTQNYNALLSIISFCNDKHIPLVIYIPPLRNDIAPPYDLKAYKLFIEQVKMDCEKNKVSYINLQNLVPAMYWGSTGAASFSNSAEIDFMHFQQSGHRLIADTIYHTIQKLFLK